MKALGCVVGFLLILLIACDKEPLEKPVGEPRFVGSCLDYKIEYFNGVACEGALVKEYFYQGKKVYVFEPGNCGADMTSEVVSEHCEHLGDLGGISGNHMINGANFDDAVYRHTVWRK
jgi:hypothetical protein